jgi:ribonuclease-3
VVNIFLRPIKRLRVSPEDKIFYTQIKRNFGIRPRNLELYRIALIHKSASTVIAKGKRVNNERLEYLGDAVLDAIVADYLFSKFPNQKEGFLTKMRSRLVSRQSLNAIAIGIGLNQMVVSHTTNTLAQKHIFGDALEAFIGALYLDKGFPETNRWIVKHLFNKHIDLDEVLVTETDYKSRMIEWSQKNKANITFDCIELDLQKGNIPLFEAKLYINGRLMGSGLGNTKKEAEQNASLVAMERSDITLSPNPSEPELDELN